MDDWQGVRPKHLTLGQVIDRLGAEDPNRVLQVGFSEPHSYRGYYADLAFEPARNVSVGDMLAAARSAVGATFQGWKGGAYEMREYTDCWIAQRGCSGESLGNWLLEFMLGNGELTDGRDRG